MLLIRAKSSERSWDSTVMPYFSSANSSQRTVLNAVVRAPMPPITYRRQRLTTLHTAAKSRRFCVKASDSGCATCGANTV